MDCIVCIWLFYGLINRIQMNYVQKTEDHPGKIMNKKIFFLIKKPVEQTGRNKKIQKNK